MKSLAKESLPIIIIFTSINLFFIFIFYLIDARLFDNLIVFIGLFNILEILAIIFFIKKRNARRKKLLVDFLLNNSYKAKDSLVKEFGSDFEDIFKGFSKKIKKKDKKIEESRSKLISYRNFIEMWAHEIKTPLAFSKLFLENNKARIGSDIADKFTLANTNIENYINQILYYARLSSSKKDYKMEEVNLKDLVSLAMKSYYPLIAEEGIVVREDIKDLKLFTDRNTAVFIISQLLSNAIKYTKGLLVIYNKGKTLYIENNGPRVEGQDLPFIFEKAFTGEVDKIHKSTGMGLYLSKLYGKDLSIDIEVIKNEDGLFTMALEF